MGYKACGKIIYDDETKTIKALHVPVILDLVQDQVRNRWYSMAVIAMIVMFVAYWSFGPIFRDPSSYADNSAPVALMTLLVYPSSSMTYGQQMIPYPVVQIVDATDRGLYGKQVTVQVQPHGQTSILPDNQNAYQATLNGTLTVTTNSQGLAVFTNLTFVVGMAMDYDMIFICDNNYVVATTTLNSNIQSLTLTPNLIGQVNVQFGQVLPVTFVVCATNMSGLPAQKVLVNVLVNPAQEFGIIFPRYGLLRGSTSVTGPDGCAIFDSLSVVGANYNYLSLLFICQGAVISTPYEELGIAVTSSITEITASMEYSNCVSWEGNNMCSMTAALHASAADYSLRGRLVYAMISAESGYTNIQYNSLYATPKMISNIAEFTNTTGVALYDEIGIYLAGSCLGSFEITFVCEGVSSGPIQFNIQSSIRQVMCVGCGHSIDLSNQFYNNSWYWVRAINWTYAGVMDKVVNLVLVYYNANATIALNVTNQDGYALWNPFRSVPRSVDTAYLMIDGIYSNPFSIQGLPSRGPGCVFIEVLQPPNGTYIIGSTTNGTQPIVRAVNSDGYGVPNVKISIGLQGQSLFDYQYFANNELMNAYVVAGGGITDSLGNLDFGSINATALQFLAGYTGSVPIVFLSGTQCSSDYRIASVLSPITTPTFVPTVTGHSFNVVVPYENVPFMVKFSSPLATNLALQYPSLYIVASPLYASTFTQSIFIGTGKSFYSSNIPSDFMVYQSSVPCNLTSNRDFICLFGDMHALAFYGNYTLVAVVAGIQSLPLSIVIPSNVSSLAVTPPSSPTMTVTLQQPFSMQPVVQVLDANGDGVYGAQVHAFLCNNPLNTALINTNDTQDNPISNPADRNGVAQFGGLAIYSAPPGSYQLCFEVFNGANKVSSPTWPVAITVSQFNVQINIISFPRIIVTEQYWAIEANISTSLPVSTLVLTLRVTGTPFFSNHSFFGWTVWVVNANALALLTNIALAYSSTPGEYTFTLSTCGYQSSTITTTLVNSPSFIKLGPNTDTQLVTNIMEIVEVPVVLSVVNGMPLSNAFVTAVLLNTSYGNATTGTLYNEFTTAMTDETGTANVKLIFTSGYPGKYFVYFQCGSLKTDPIQIYLQNQVASVTLNSSTSAIKLQYLYPGDFIIAYLRDINGDPIANKLVVAEFVGMIGEPVGYAVSDDSGKANIYPYCSVFVPGQYQIQISADGINAPLIPVTVINTMFPDFSNFDIHDAQVITFLICLLTIPLFIGNSVRQPAWQLVLSVFALIGLIYVKSEYQARFFSETAPIFTALQSFTTFTFIAAPVTFAVVVYVSCIGRLRKKRFNFYETKKKSCETYIRNLLRSRDDALLKDREESIFAKLKWTIKASWSAFVNSFRPNPEVSSDAFFFPQRMILGFGVSVCCLFMTASGSVLLFSWPIYLLGLLHDNLSSYLTLASQMENYMDAQSGGRGAEAYTQQMVDTIVALNITPFGSAVLMQILTGDIPRLMQWMQQLDDFTVFLRQALINCANPTIVVIAILILFCKVLVFPKYKHNILLLRRGRYKDVFLHPDDWSIASAANYIGLSAIHAAIGHFLLCTTVVMIATFLQYKPFWRYVYSYYPVVIAFLIGFPFISKMTTKFIVAKFVVEKYSIKHFRIWAIFDFMWIFVNLLSVLALTSIRFVIGLLASFIIITRMDEPIMHSKNAHFDYGYSAYAGTLLIDHYHNNPILLVFVEHFIQDMKEHRRIRKERFLRQTKEKSHNSTEKTYLLLNVTLKIEDEDSLEAMQAERHQTIKRRAVLNKWWMVYLLAKNPSLLPFRSHNIPPPPPPPEKETH